MKSKLPVSIGYIGMSVVNTQ